MKQIKVTSSQAVVYSTKAEVLEAAWQNIEFFNSYSEALKQAWTFFKS